MRRFQAATGLLLTAFFAVAGSFHHHPIPKPTHDHAGFCSASSVGITLESCALCKAAQTPAHLTVRTFTAVTLDRATRPTESPVFVSGSASTLLHEPRAPPTV